MSLMWAIYWIDVIGNAGVLLIITSVILAIAALVCLILGAIMRVDGTEETVANGIKLHGFFRPISIALIVTSAIVCFLPRQQTLYAMMAANIGQQVVESPEMKEIGGKALKILNQKLDELAGDEKKL